MTTEHPATPNGDHTIAGDQVADLVTATTQPAADSAVGIRRTLLEGGFSESQADAMAGGAYTWTLDVLHHRFHTDMAEEQARYQHARYLEAQAGQEKANAGFRSILQPATIPVETVLGAERVQVALAVLASLEDWSRFGVTLPETERTFETSLDQATVQVLLRHAQGLDA